jgi:hypothetical protein
MKATRRPRQLWKEPGEGGRMRTARESSEGEGKTGGGVQGEGSTLCGLMSTPAHATD